MVPPIRRVHPPAGDDPLMAARMMDTPAEESPTYGRKQCINGDHSHIHAILYPDEEQGGYVAECLDVDVTTQGETIEHALAMLKEAVELALDDDPDREIVALGQPIMTQVEVTWHAPTARSERC
jgi:predicted RNase H-like HicB family nuclease